MVLCFSLLTVEMAKTVERKRERVMLSALCIAPEFKKKVEGHIDCQ